MTNTRVPLRWREVRREPAGSLRISARAQAASIPAAVLNRPRDGRTARPSPSDLAFASRR